MPTLTLECAIETPGILYGGCYDAQHQHAYGAGSEFERDRTAALHFLDLAEVEIHDNLRNLYENADDSMLAAAAAAMKFTESQPNNRYIIPEKSPTAKGTGRAAKQDGIKQFPGDGIPAHAGPTAAAAR